MIQNLGTKRREWPTRELWKVQRSRMSERVTGIPSGHGLRGNEPAASTSFSAVLSSPGLNSPPGLFVPVPLPCNGPPNLICPPAPLPASSPNSLAASALLSTIPGSSGPSLFSPTSTSSFSVDSFHHRLPFPQPLSVAILVERDVFSSRGHAPGGQAMMGVVDNVTEDLETGGPGGGM